MRYLLVLMESRLPGRMPCWPRTASTSFRSMVRPRHRSTAICSGRRQAGGIRPWSPAPAAAACSNRAGAIVSREREWAARFNAMGITVLMVDSYGPRHQGEMCAPAHFDAAVYLARPLDAYAALRYLQAQDFVQPDRIGLIGWSAGAAPC